jgi:antitoxin VapB
MFQLAKIFQNGRSQAVRLPASYRFDCKEVYISRDPASGNVILSRKPESWDDFFAFVDTHAKDMPPDFLADRDRSPPQKRNIL